MLHQRVGAEAVHQMAAMRVTSAATNAMTPVSCSVKPSAWLVVRGARRSRGTGAVPTSTRVPTTALAPPQRRERA
jgi:hypothetical protein